MISTTPATAGCRRAWATRTSYRAIPRPPGDRRFRRNGTYLEGDRLGFEPPRRPTYPPKEQLRAWWCSPGVCGGRGHAGPGPRFRAWLAGRIRKARGLPLPFMEGRMPGATSVASRLTPTSRERREYGPDGSLSGERPESTCGLYACAQWPRFSRSMARGGSAPPRPSIRVGWWHTRRSEASRPASVLYRASCDRTRPGRRRRGVQTRCTAHARATRPGTGMRRESPYRKWRIAPRRTNRFGRPLGILPGRTLFPTWPVKSILPDLDGPVVAIATNGILFPPGQLSDTAPHR